MQLKFQIPVRCDVSPYMTSAVKASLPSDRTFNAELYPYPNQNASFRHYVSALVNAFDKRTDAIGANEKSPALNSPM